MHIKCKELNAFHHKSGELLVSDSKMYYGSKIAVCKIDEEDFDRLKQFGWYISKKGYVFTMIDGKCHQLHRFILGLTNPKISVDHDDGNKLNNKKSNLIPMSHKENTLKSWHIQKTHDVLFKPIDMIDKDTGIVLMQFDGVKKLRSICMKRVYRIVLIKEQFLMFVLDDQKHLVDMYGGGTYKICRK